MLQFEADRRAFIITINSFGTELTKDDRSKLYPRCGCLNPDGLFALARADDYEQVRAVAEYYGVHCYNIIHTLHCCGWLFDVLVLVQYFFHSNTELCLMELGQILVIKLWKINSLNMRFVCNDLGEEVLY